jgi:hypothetical protein
MNDVFDGCICVLGTSWGGLGIMSV